MKKFWNTFKMALSWAVIIFTICVVLFTVVSMRTVDARQRNIFGYKMMIVQSDSMSATDFSAGDLIIVKEVDPSKLKEGDIISFISRNSHNQGETVTHKIRSVTVDKDGWPGFITYGTTTDTDDEAIVGYTDVLGLYVGRIRNMGTFFAFLRTPKGYITFILIPMLLMIFFSLFNCIRLFSGAQKQVEQERQTAAEEERKEIDQLRRELNELRALVMANITDPQQPSAERKKVAGAPKSVKKAAHSEKKTEKTKQPAVKHSEVQESKKQGHVAASTIQKKEGAQPKRKPAPTPKAVQNDPELDLDSIMAEFRPKDKKTE